MKILKINLYLFFATLIFSPGLITGQTTSGSMGSGSASSVAAVNGKDDEYCRDTIPQSAATLTLNSYGFNPVDYQASTKLWVDADFSRKDTSAHDAYFVGAYGTDSIILQYCGSLILPSAHGLNDGVHYKLLTNGSIGADPDSIWHASVGHLHNDSIFTLDPDFTVFLIDTTFGGGGSGGGGVVDADWFNQATGSAPDDINQKIYTLNDVSIGSTGENFFGLTIEKTAAQMLLLRHPSFDAGEIRFEGLNNTYDFGFGIGGNFELSSVTNSTVPFRVDVLASSLGLILDNGFVSFGDYPNNRSDIGASAQHQGSSGGVVPGNFLYTGTGGILFSVPIGTYPLQPYVTSTTLDGNLDHTVTTTVNQTLPAGFSGKMLFIKNNAADTITIYPTAPEKINGLDSVFIEAGETTVFQSSGNAWQTILSGSSASGVSGGIERIKLNVFPRPNNVTAATSNDFETISDALNGATLLYVEYQFATQGGGMNTTDVNIDIDGSDVFAASIPPLVKQQTVTGSQTLLTDQVITVEVSASTSTPAQGLSVILGVAY